GGRGRDGDRRGDVPSASRRLVGRRPAGPAREHRRPRGCARPRDRRPAPRGRRCDHRRRVKVALAQITGEPFAVERNRELARKAAVDAFEQGADLVVLPELIVHGYVVDRERLAPLAEPLLGPTFESWHELARAAGGYVVGGFCEREEDELYNSAIAVGP